MVLVGFHNFWSLSEGIYRTISFISHPKIRHKSFSVLVDTSLLCFKRWSVLCDEITVKQKGEKINMDNGNCKEMY